MLDKIKEGRSCHSIAEDLGISKTQIQGIKGTKSIRQQWETGGRAERKYSKVRKLCYEDLDRVVWEWSSVVVCCSWSCSCCLYITVQCTVENEIQYVAQNLINAFNKNSSADERPPLLRDHFDGNLQVVVQEGDYCMF